ncbi:uncharacterized protein LOC114518672 [Dendronephthya gigantea]|uniref:uncharacterized protein LOC114518672 n=1 Tax=Dendronephthya gigantea TaxID=151771 RepID=UPI00106B935B|nr:uncharacterized protein LOC114518672 [Dendronephthya gigantea]
MEDKHSNRVFVKSKDTRKSLKRFIKDISCNTPICAILPLDEELRRVCDKIKRSVPVKEFPSDIELLQRKCPALFGIFSSLSDSFAPAEFIPLLTDLLNIADNAFKDCEAPQDDSVVNPSSLLANFPSLKPVRGRGTYAADKGKQTFENPCTKKSGRHPTLLPGIFLIFCQHGINYGYSVMTTNESPDMPFTILRSRFTRAPRVVVYDNACNLHSYCLNGDPTFFKDTQFLVDRLHWADHTGCSSAYHISCYPDYDYLNSQIAEQSNSGLKKIKGPLSYMNDENFSRHCSFYLWFKNREIMMRNINR